ncbi:hypothetical protein AAVH_23308 [Aphelenchoides avenae]|nr:hypothetical protein AAVH_23308 [Aphelenchus avenae]
MVEGDTLVIPGSSMISSLWDIYEVCELNIVESDVWAFGSPLARSYCHVCDIVGQQIGFAEHNRS